VDGPTNSVAELNTRGLPPGAGNEHANAFAMEEIILRRESDAARDLSLAEYRFWKVFNPASKNAIGHLTGYELVPGGNAVPYMSPDAATRKRARFMDHHVWVTRQRDEEANAAGPYPNQNPVGGGLAKWLADDESLVGEDVVVWYTMGVTHHPRPEEWPIMPVATAGFKLVPSGFFDRNPALDVPE
jgi:primary-amine oxidase